VEKALIPISIVFLLAIIVSFWVKAILDNNNYKVRAFVVILETPKISLTWQEIHMIK
jgi:hypothetical protein